MSASRVPVTRRAMLSSILERRIRSALNPMLAARSLFKREGRKKRYVVILPAER